MKLFQMAQALFAMALAFLAFSFGWAGGLRRAGSLDGARSSGLEAALANEALGPVWILLGASVLCVLALGLIAWGLRSRPSQFPAPAGRPVDLTEVYRDARRHGSRLTLFSDEAADARFLVPLPEDSLKVEVDSEFVVEHWKGPAVWVTTPRSRWRLEAAQLVRFQLRRGEAFSVRDAENDLKADAPWLVAHRRRLESPLS